MDLITSTRSLLSCLFSESKCLLSELASLLTHNIIAIIDPTIAIALPTRAIIKPTFSMAKLLFGDNCTGYQNLQLLKRFIDIYTEHECIKNILGLRI